MNDLVTHLRDVISAAMEIERMDCASAWGTGSDLDRKITTCLKRMTRNQLKASLELLAAYTSDRQLQDAISVVKNDIWGKE